MNYILVSTNGKPSIRAIQRLMEEECRIVYTHQRIPRFNENDLCIRWGCSTPINFNGANVINRSDAVNLASNKARSRMKMQEEGVSVPNTFLIEYLPLDDDDYIEGQFILRPPHHKKGQNFYIVNNFTSLEQYGVQVGWYLSKLINKTNEYRVHVGHGKVLVIHEKPLLEGEIRGNQAITGLSWSNAIPWEQYKRKMCKLACDAVKCCGLDMGAVDIIKDAQNNYYVCEVNTAPTLNDSPYSCKRYASYFDWIIRHPNNEWFDYTQWNSGRSYAWKNEQLGD